MKVYVVMEDVEEDNCWGFVEPRAYREKESAIRVAEGRVRDEIKENPDTEFERQDPPSEGVATWIMDSGWRIAIYELELY